MSMTTEGVSRRETLFKIALAFNGVVGVPVVRYLLSPVTRGRKPGYDSWISLGPIDQFPAGETRLATYRNPVANITDGETANIPSWDARCVGSRNPDCSCARATAELITRMARAHPARQSVACSNTGSRLSMASCTSKRASCRRPVLPRHVFPH
jgi:hypothetical protein